MSYSYSMSSSSSSSGGGAVLGMSSGGAAVSGGGLSVGGGGVGLQGGSTVLSGGSVGVGGGGLGVGVGSGAGLGGGSVSFARKTNVARSAGGAGASGNSMMMALSALGGGTATYAGSHELGANPKAVIQRRDREKHDINDLNIKLAEYIEQNGYYRIKVKEQEKLIIKIKGEFESIEARLRQIYDAELANLRGVIDATAKEKAAVELKVQTLEALYKDFRAKYEAELSAHESTRLRLPKLEKELSEKDAQIDYLAKTLTALEPQVSALKAQISTYQKESIEAKMGADAEIVTRVELESKLVTKQDEIDFLKRVYEEKLRMALDFDIDSDATYSNDLAEALKDIRAEYQAQLESIRGDTDESWFQSKFNTMMQTSQKQGQELAIAREETARMKARFNESVTSVNTFKAKIASLEASMAEMTADFENEKRLHAVALADRDAQIVEYKRQIAAHILELKGLMDAKLSLDEEIATYRRLLLAGGSTTVVGGGGLHGVSVSGGGGGITVSGGGGGLTVSGGGAGIAVGGGGGGAGIAVGGGGGGGAGASFASGGGMSFASGGGMAASASSTVSASTAKTTFAAMSMGTGAIAETAADGRFIIVENKTGAGLDLGGWKIERCVDMGDLIVFAFPAGTVLAAFGTLKIWANGVAGASAAAGNLIWAGGNSWGIGFNATNELKSADGLVQASLTQKTSLA